MGRKLEAISFEWRGIPPHVGRQILWLIEFKISAAIISSINMLASRNLNDTLMDIYPKNIDNVISNHERVHFDGDLEEGEEKAKCIKRHVEKHDEIL